MRERPTVHIQSKYTRILAVTAAIGSVLISGACKEMKKGQASGEVSRNWTPPAQEQVMGVSAADAKAAIQARLAQKPPAPVTDDVWKHVKKLYATFDQSLLWVDDKGVQSPRVAALLNTIASADSE